MKPTTTFAAIVLAALSFAAANTALAMPGMGMGMGPGMGPGMSQSAGPGMRHRMAGPETAAAAQARLAAARTELKITPAQEAAWGAYAAVVQRQAEQREATRSEMRSKMTDPKTTEAERATLRDAAFKAREAHIAERNAAYKDLQAVLTPEQRTLADRWQPGGRGHRMAMRGGARGF